MRSRLHLHNFSDFANKKGYNCLCNMPFAQKVTNCLLKQVAVCTMSPDICAALVVCQAAKLPSPRVPGPHVISDVKPPQPVPGPSPDQSCSSLAPPPLSRVISNISTAAGGGVWFTVHSAHITCSTRFCNLWWCSEVWGVPTSRASDAGLCRLIA